MELKDSVLIKMNESCALGGDGILMYQDRLCVPDVDDLRTRMWQRPMVPDISYVQVPPKCIMILRRSIGGMA